MNGPSTTSSELNSPSNVLELLDKYKLTSDDEETLSWKSVLELDSQTKASSDWYSTKTFQVFLDALDINSPVYLVDKDKYSKSKDGEQKHRQNLNPNESTESKPPKKKEAEPVKNDQKTCNNHMETILSAEALKILSELPDLSHMSVTRSFIFPNGLNSSSVKR